MVGVASPVGMSVTISVDRSSEIVQVGVITLYVSAARECFQKMALEGLVSLLLIASALRRYDTLFVGASVVTRTPDPAPSRGLARRGFDTCVFGLVREEDVLSDAIDTT